jgi:hypothetical protein
MIDALRRGQSGEAIDASYTAGAYGPANPYARRDNGTIFRWNEHNAQDQVLAALGSYNLSVTAENVTAGSATLRFSGQNSTNVASLGSLIPGFRPKSGPLSEVIETFSWTETVKW